PVSAWGKSPVIFFDDVKIDRGGCGMDCVWLFLYEWSFVVRHLDFSCIFQILSKKGYSQQRTKIARQNLIFSRINPSFPPKPSYEHITTEDFYRRERVLKFVSNARKGRCNCPLRRSSVLLIFAVLDEVFGPVLRVKTFSTQDEAIQMANDSQ
ncbi:hypothetical protein IGI04_023182, partial [Brassica rapa subsp. trilocularis]